jgi:aspartyl-tRNA(Asn)/glutamyl-tRNA(Gln) amidotransferase subunit B
MTSLVPIIGLEIHVRLKTRSKMFCACPNVDDLAAPNTAICPVCTGAPGALPAVNEQAVRLGVRAGLTLGCTIPDQAHFDRKNYFYPDLPKGYQISQYDFPIAQKGNVVIEVPGNKPPRDTIRIDMTRAHLEEDAAKNMHDAKGTTLVDFNRAGVPLLEIVTEPDLRSPLEAKFFLQELQAILRAAEVSDADMEKGYMRCDANVSLLEVDENHLPVRPGLNPKIEIKNLNSFKAVERALNYEIERQRELYAEGDVPQGATRGWDENRGETFEQRLKETNADYRYFPEPDLQPLQLSTVREEERAHVPELPARARARMSEEYGFSADDARYFIANEGWATFAEAVMGELANWIEATDKRNDVSGSEALAAKRGTYAKLVGGWLTSKLAGLLTAQNKSLAEANITAENFAEFVHLIDNGTVNSANAQKLLALMVETGTDPSHLLEEHNLGQSSDPQLIKETVERMIEQHPDQAAQIKAGKTNLIMWFVGSIMKATEGRMNPEDVKQEITRQLHS